MTYATDPRVDAYIEALPEWQQASIEVAEPAGGHDECPADGSVWGRLNAVELVVHPIADQNLMWVRSARAPWLKLVTGLTWPSNVLPCVEVVSA